MLEALRSLDVWSAKNIILFCGRYPRFPLVDYPCMFNNGIVCYSACLNLYFIILQIDLNFQIHVHISIMGMQIWIEDCMMCQTDKTYFSKIRCDYNPNI